MNLAFTKMHGLGNDFVVIDAIHQPFAPDPGLLRHLTDRRTGIGCDQVLVVDPAPASDVDFGYRIYNADGSEVGQCGNGARCLARFVAEHGLSSKTTLRVRTTTATLELQRLGDGRVRVNMGVPRFEPESIPLALPARLDRYALTIADGETVTFGAVSLGNPHAVIAVDDVDSAAVARIGMALQHHAAFPESVNVGFLQMVDRGHARLRVYERGVGETLACGSGACAALVIGRLRGQFDEQVEIVLPGGTLSLEWAGRAAPVWMTGPATTSFEGRIEWQK